MLLVHQAGSVKVGEVVRYTLKYTPSDDRILPTPSHLHLKIKNTSAIPLRAAWVHGPYALHVAAYPSSFNPHHKVEDPKRDGIPEYEPMLKAAGSWQAKLLVPEHIRETGADLGKRRQSARTDSSAANGGDGSVTWIIEIASQVLFSTSASVSFEVLIGRDERSLDLGFAAVASHGHGGPGQLTKKDNKERKKKRKDRNLQTNGVYSRAVTLMVEDTETLWDKPALPSWDDETPERGSRDQTRSSVEFNRPKGKRKKVHLVVVTHGLHSNLGADMLFLKESIDATVKEARLEVKRRRERYRTQSQNQEKDKDSTESKDSSKQEANEASTAPLSGGQEEIEDNGEDSDDEEETIVRGFAGNAVRTENGIQYLGKRLAKYILRFTYPDQPFLPIKKPLRRTLTDTFKSEADKAKRDGTPSHHGSSIHSPQNGAVKEQLPYRFTSISFVGHSLGGLIQTYAIAYIQKHSPTFFTQIRPVNFVCMASPMLGLSNENPLYVKFALDFGLVGRTGQDLGLTWRPPTIARGGWNAMIGGLGPESKKKQPDPSTKPLLRVLPTGPAHQVLRLFRNRTVYSNVVNDGIVPLRTSCLLFLDWRGLGKVEKARRENGLIGTVAEWGWAELTGANQSSSASNLTSAQNGDDSDDNEHVRQGEGDAVPQPADDETAEDNKRPTSRFDETRASLESRSDTSLPSKASNQDKGIFDNFLGFFHSSNHERSKTPPPTSKKTQKAIRRAQTLHHGEDEMPDDIARGQEGASDNPTMRPRMPHMPTGQIKGKGLSKNGGDKGHPSQNEEPEAPPKTSIFESAGDILHPPLPSRQWIVDPTSRTRTIFHDRVYHPDDIPPPPAKRPGSRLSRSLSFDSTTPSSNSSHDKSTSADAGGMKVEEKIARAYHSNLSWRKVLVRLEPDAHNNMIVRRMFANAYGWPVIKHLCDTHFADTFAATTRDEEEPARERAKPMHMPVPETGEEVAGQTAKQVPERTMSETREARDELADLNVSRQGAWGSYSSNKASLSREGSVIWDDSYLEGSDDDDSDVDERNLVQRILNPMPAKKPESVDQPAAAQKSNGSLKGPVTPFTDGHRGLAPTSPRSSVSLKSPASTKPTFESANVEAPMATNQLVQEPETLMASAGRVADVGLRKSVEDHVSPTRNKGSKSGE